MEKGVFGEVEYEKVCDLILIFTTFVLHEDRQ